MRNSRCARCGRVTFLPAVVIGGQPLGPVCARKAGLIEPKRRLIARHEAGERLRPYTLTCARQALGMEGKMLWQ